MCNSEIPKTGALTVKYLSSNLMKNHQFVTIGPFLFYALPPKHWKELFITVCWNMWKGVLQIISLVFSQIDIPYATANINSLMKYLKPRQKWMCCTWILGMLSIRCLLIRRLLVSLASYMVVAEGVLAATFPECQNQWLYINPLLGVLRSTTG